MTWLRSDASYGEVLLGFDLRVALNAARGDRASADAWVWPRPFEILWELEFPGQHHKTLNLAEDLESVSVIAENLPDVDVVQLTELDKCAVDVPQSDDWEFLGFDVFDSGLYPSVVANCGRDFRSDRDPRIRVNEWGLFTTIADAVEGAGGLLEYAPEHPVNRIIGVYRRKGC